MHINSDILFRSLWRSQTCHRKTLLNYNFQFDASFLVLFGWCLPGHRIRCSWCSWDCFERHSSFTRHCSIFFNSTLETFIPLLSLCRVSLQCVISHCLIVESALCGYLFLSDFLGCNHVCRSVGIFFLAQASIVYGVVFSVHLLQRLWDSSDLFCCCTFMLSLGAAVSKVWYWSTKGVWCLNCNSVLLNLDLS